MSNRVEKIVNEISQLTAYEIVELKSRLSNLWGEDDPDPDVGVREPRLPRPPRPSHGAEAEVVIEEEQ